MRRTRDKTIGRAWLAACLAVTLGCVHAVHAQEADTAAEPPEAEALEPVETKDTDADDLQPETPKSDPEGEPSIGIAGSDPAASNPPGRYLVVAIDSSFSMATSDPRRYAIQAAQMLIAFAAQDDSVALISYGRKARTVLPFTVMAGVADRERAQDRARRIGIGGGTNFRVVLAEAAKLLEAADAPEGSRVLILSDGHHTQGGEAREVLRDLLVFRRRKWVVSTIALNQTHRMVLIEKIAELTGGRHVRINDPRDLVSAFLRLSGTADRYWAYRGSLLTDFRTVPGSRRLVFVGHKADTRTRILGVRSAAPPPSEGWQHYHYPRKPDRRALFDVFTVENPQAATFRVDLRGKLIEGMSFQRFPFRIELDPSTRLQVFAGEPFRLTVAVVEDEDQDPAALDAFRAPDNVYMDAEIIRDRDKRAVGVLKLRAVPEDGAPRRVVFTGQIDLPAIGGSEPTTEPYTAHLIAEIERASMGGTGWIRHERFAFQATADAAPSRILLSRTDAPLGTLWTGDKPAGGELTVSVRGDAPIQVTAKPGHSALSVTPATFTVRPEQPMQVRFQFDPTQAEAGAFGGRITFVGSTAADDADVPDESLKVRASLFHLNGLDEDGRIGLPETQPGQTAARSLKLTVTPGPIPLVVAVSPLTGPDDQRLETALDDGTLWTDIPELAKSGDHEGTITVSFPPSAPERPADRVIPMHLVVREPLPTIAVQPETLVIAARRKGEEYTGSLRLSLNFVAPVEMRLKASDLTGTRKRAGGERLWKVSSFLDIEMEPEAGWDGKTLAPGRSYGLRYKVWLSLDHPFDTYTGELTLTPVYQGKEYESTTVRVKLRASRDGG